MLTCTRNIDAGRMKWPCGTTTSACGRHSTVRDGKIVEYHVNVKVAFVVEPAEIEP